MDALGKLKSPKSAPALLAMLQPGYPPMIRRAAARCLDGVAGKEHAEVLHAAWQAETDPLVRSEIERLLAKEPFNRAVDEKSGAFVPGPR